MRKHTLYILFILITAAWEPASILATEPICPGGSNPDPHVIFCDDFETDKLSSYFEYDNDGGDFVRVGGVGVDSSTAMRGIFKPGQPAAGGFKLAFGKTPDPYFKAVDAGTANYREIFWRIYVKNQSGWISSGNNEKFTRAIVFANSNWAEAAIGHLWSGSSGSSVYHLLLDPASGTDTAGNLVTTQYNDFANLTWLGAVSGATPIFDSNHVGQWYCVEAHMKLNDAGQSNGVFEFWVNGNLDAQKTGMNWLGSYNSYGINAVFFENYANTPVPVQEERYFDNIAVSTQRIGCISGDATPPSPPTGLTVK